MALITNPEENITVPKKLSDQWYDFIFNWCLQRDPKKRWSADELIHHPYLKRNSGCDSNQDSNNSQIDLDDINLVEDGSLSKTHPNKNKTDMTNIRHSVLLSKKIWFLFI